MEMGSVIPFYTTVKFSWLTDQYVRRKRPRFLECIVVIKFAAGRQLEFLKGRSYSTHHQSSASHYKRPHSNNRIL
ncbi:hypothetical protein ABKV19_013921 [Rosa sericea]